MTVNINYQSKITAVETLEANVDSLGTDKQVTHNQFDTTKALTSGTTPPVTKIAASVQALTAGAATIDLTNLLGVNGAVVDGTGLKVQILKIKNKAESANPISIAPGASNGYDIFGADFKVTLQPGQEATLYGNDATPDIAAEDKTLDLAGTGAQECEIIVVMG